MVPAAPPAAHAAAPPPPAALLPHQAVKARYPHCLVQFEDFATEKAFKILAHMRDKCAMGGGGGAAMEACASAPPIRPNPALQPDTWPQPSPPLQAAVLQ